MRVVAMAFSEVFHYFLAILVVATGFGSHWIHFLSYVSSGLMLLMVLNFIQSIPLKLNWSAHLYGNLMTRSVTLLLFIIFAYGINYWMIGIIPSDQTETPGFWTSVYFSITTFTTLQFGEFRPVVDARPLVGIEVLTGLLFFPILASMTWLYCEYRLHKPTDQETNTPQSLSPDPILGGYIETPNEQTKKEDDQRNRSFVFSPCSKCKNDSIRVYKHFDLIGRVYPFPLFTVHCNKCGQRTKQRITAYRAADDWNSKNKLGNP